MKSIKNIEHRRIFFEQQIKKDLSSLYVQFENENNIHCENCIGGIPVPLGIAGPLIIRHQAIVKKTYIPLATTEGALVASVNRGCKSISLAGGTSVYSEKKGTTRGPVFVTRSLDEAIHLKKWILDHTKELRLVAERTSRFLQYISQKIQIIGSSVYVRFIFDTKDAMGMNMATIASQELVSYIEENTGAECISVAANYDIDKKAGWLNFIEGRGIAIWSQIKLPLPVIKKVLKTTPDRIFEVWIKKCLIGSAISGSLGFNSHFANIVGAFYIATGQDIAHVVEGSLGMTEMYMDRKKSLHISVFLPSVMVGTIGGGTNLGPQSQALSIMSVRHPEELAMVLGGAVLAGEISLLASLAEGSLSLAHKKLGR